MGMQALRDIDQGEQIFISYGEGASNLYLLLHYDFTIPANPFFDLRPSGRMFISKAPVNYLLRSMRWLAGGSPEELRDGLWTGSVERHWIISEDVLWRMRVGATVATARELARMEAFGWRRIPQIYNDVVDRIGGQEADQLPKDLARWVRSDLRLFSRLWLNAHVTQHRLRKETARSLRQVEERLLSKSDPWLAQLLSTARETLSRWTLLARRLARALRPLRVLREKLALDF